MSYYWSGNTIQSGSTNAEDVKRWQTYLKQNGYYTGAIDGSFGPQTKAGTEAYQKAYGLTVDGIAGPKTLGQAGFKNYNTPLSAPTFTPHDTTSWNDTEAGKTALDAKDKAASALTGYGNPDWGRQEEWKAWIDKQVGRDPFSYDFNADALYHQYKDMYMKQGQMAMQDTMGQAAAMTGGYGNSYAASVGNQAYQQSLQQLNGVIPELYQLALSKYNMEGQQISDALAALGADREAYMQDWQSGYDRLVDAYNIASDNYTTGGNMHYTDLGNRNAAIDRENDNAWQVADWEDRQRRDALERAEASESGGYKVATDPNGKKYIADANGNPVETEKKIPDSVYTRAASFTSNTALADYLDVLEASDAIDVAQADALYAQYADYNEKYTQNDDGSPTISYRDMVGSTSGWEVDNDGGTNWLWGVDNNAIVIAPNGEKVRLDNLVDTLVAEGMSKSEAKTAVKKLQKNLGI